MNKNIINPFNKGGLMSKKSLLIYGLAVVVLIAVGGLVWWKNRSSADIPYPGGVIKTGTVYGRAFHKKFNVSDVSVSIFNSTTKNGETIYYTPATYHTGEGGYYQFNEVPFNSQDGYPDPYRLFALKFVAQNYECIERLEGNETVIVDKEKNEKDIELKNVYSNQFAGINGYVKDAKTGNPIIGANVSIKREFDYYAEHPDLNPLTNTDGFYSTLCSVENGTYSIKASSPGYKEKTETILIDDSKLGKYLSQNFFLEPGGQNQPSGNQSGGTGGANPGGGPGTP